MRRVSSKFQLSIAGELNVTPLLDLALVLLIVFMIATPFMENNLDLLIPTSSSAQKNTPANQVQIIKVQQDFSLIFNQKHVTAEELETKLRGMYAKDPEIAVIIHAHKELSIQRFVYIVDLLGRIGISRIGVVARQEKRSSHRP